MNIKNSVQKRLINRADINEELVLISESNTDYITRTGKVYKDYGNGKMFLKTNHINKHNGYVYIGITCKDGINRNRRLHRLVAIAFIKNPNPIYYDIVGHMDNNKYNYDLNNLYWTNTSENTKKAFDDKLAMNDIGVLDSQAHPIMCFDNKNNVISVYGSIKEAGRCIVGFSSSSISKSVDKTTKGLKGYYFKRISKTEYESFKGEKNLTFTTNYIDKSKKMFKAINKFGTEVITDNQSRFAKDYGLNQASISQQIRKPNGGYVKDWFFKRIS